MDFHSSQLPIGRKPGEIKMHIFLCEKVDILDDQMVMMFRVTSSRPFYADPTGSWITNFSYRGLCGWYVSRFGSSVSQFASWVSQFGMVCKDSYVIWTVRLIRHDHSAYESNQYIRCWCICFGLQFGWCGSCVNFMRTVRMACIHCGPCVDF